MFPQFHNPQFHVPREKIYMSIKQQALNAMMPNKNNILDNRKLRRNSILDAQPQCFREECNATRTKGKLFCSASCSKLHDECQRAAYHAKRAIKKRDAIAQSQPTPTQSVTPMKEITL